MSVAGVWRGAENDVQLPFHIKIDPTKLSSPRTWALEGTAWNEHHGHRSNETGITIWWQGGQAAETPSDQNGALRRQLEALGYLR